MQKILLAICIMLLISAVACQQGVKKIYPENAQTGAQATTTGDAAVDAVGNDLNNADSVGKDLSADQLGDLDSGLNDVQKI